MNYEAPDLALKFTGSFGKLATWPFTAARQAAIGATGDTVTIVDGEDCGRGGRK